MSVSRVIVAMTLPLIFASCGNRNFELPDGRFDRAGYRALMIPTCEQGMASGDSSIPAAARNRFCTCVIDRILASNNDEEMRTKGRDSALRERMMSEARDQCMSARPPVFDPQTGRWSDPSGAAYNRQDAEAPPPEAPPPPPPGSGELPPPIMEPDAVNGAN